MHAWLKIYTVSSCTSCAKTLAFNRLTSYPWGKEQNLGKEGSYQRRIVGYPMASKMEWQVLPFKNRHAKNLGVDIERLECQWSHWHHHGNTSYSAPILGRWQTSPRAAKEDTIFVPSCHDQLLEMQKIQKRGCVQLLRDWKSETICFWFFFFLKIGMKSSLLRHLRNLWYNILENNN